MVRATLGGIGVKACTASLLVLVGLAGCAPHGAQLESPTPVIARATLPKLPSHPETGASEHMQGCFDGQMGEHSWSARVAAATIHIHEPGKLGDKSATGFVVRDSSALGSTHNRMVTAGHVVEDIVKAGGVLEIANASGVRMGYAQVVERPASHHGVAADGRVLAVGDLAVIEMVGYFDGGQNAFDAIEGIDLSHEFPAHELEGVFSTPSGIVPGASGSPVLDTAGRAVGVLTSSITSPRDLDGDNHWSANVKLDAADAMWYASYLAQPGEIRQIVMPARSRSFAEGLDEPATLAALGHAGALAAANQRFESVGRVTIPTFAAQVCVVYRGNMYPAGHVPVAPR